MLGGDRTAWLPKGEQSDSSYTTCLQPLEGAEGICSSGEKELADIYQVVAQHSLYHHYKRGESFGQADVHMVCCTSILAPTVK